MNSDLFWHRRFTQQAGWTRELRAYLFRQAGLDRARRVLEVGCGTGAILADLPASAALHGLDLNLPRLTLARIHAPAASLANGDALALPYPSRTFDATLCHFLLLWAVDPLQALCEMARVTRPGGALLALAEPDYSGRIDQPPELSQLGQWQAESLRRQGADPDLGRGLAELFERAGIAPVETGTISRGESDPPAPDERALEWAVLESDLGGFVPAEVLSKMKELDETAWERGERVVYVPTYYAWGRVPPE
ncbi:MAG: class I SAM-dependent methyltransferase [Chloroflexi bacterium]|nr:class I SAM-dependent methyltransferase [Chloroflexota bacterium]